MEYVIAAKVANDHWNHLPKTTEEALSKSEQNFYKDYTHNPITWIELSDIKQKTS